MLYFLHACAWASLGTQREYQVRYTDGSTVAIPILPAGVMQGQSENIQDWFSPNVVDKPFARFVALPDPTKPEDPSAMRYIYILEWRNPHPGKPIESIAFQGGDSQVTLFVLGVTGHE